jgi:AbrB family looped-hinge helix DNA binding protein
VSNVTVSSKGQIVIPQSVRNRLGLTEGTRLEVRTRNGRLVLSPAGKGDSDRDWRSWRGALTGTRALEEHRTEHLREKKR